MAVSQERIKALVQQQQKEIRTLMALAQQHQSEIRMLMAQVQQQQSEIRTLMAQVQHQQDGVKELTGKSGRGDGKTIAAIETWKVDAQAKGNRISFTMPWCVIEHCVREASLELDLDHFLLACCSSSVCRTR